MHCAILFFFISPRIMIPSINQPQWSLLLQGKLMPKLASLSLQLKIHALQVAVKSGKSPLVEAIKQLYDYCSANPKMYEKDLEKIFK